MTREKLLLSIPVRDPMRRMELRVMFRELFERFPRIGSAGEPEYLLSNFDNGITRQPFTLRV